MSRLCRLNVLSAEQAVRRSATERTFSFARAAASEPLLVGKTAGQCARRRRSKNYGGSAHLLVETVILVEAARTCCTKIARPSWAS